MTTNPKTDSDHDALLARAVGILDRDAIIVANAGAGKTYLLVEHYFALLEAGLEPSQIVAFTFTEKAANELKERIVKRLHSHPGFCELPPEILKQYRGKILIAPIGTIHQFCLRIIEASRQAGDRATYKIVDEALELALQETVLRAFIRRRFESEDPDAMRLLGRFGIRDFSRILERYLSFLPLETEERFPLPLPEEEERVLLETVERLGIPLWEEIQKRKNALGWMSFADMERRALDLLAQPSESLRQFLRPIGHVLVDEFQDTAPIQIRLITALRDQGREAGKRIRLFCVGDPKQSIYRFRDVDRNLLQVTENEILSQGGEKFDFVVNFRSTPEILELVNAYTRSAFPEAQDSLPKRESFSGSLARLVVSNSAEESPDAAERADAEAERVATAIAARRGALPLDRIAVLYRASSSASPLIRELQKRNIPYSVRGGQNLFERQEILDLHRLIYFLADTTDDISLVGALRSPLFLISDAALFFLCEGDRKISLWERLQDPKALLALEREDPGETKKLVWALERLNHWLALSQTQSAHRLIEEGLRREGWGDLYARAGGGAQALLAIEQWLDWLKSLEEDHAPLRFVEAAKILKEVAVLLPNKTPLGDTIASKNSVQLMTIHAAKGLQFDTVFLIGMNRKTHAEYPLLQRVGGALALKVPDEAAKKRKTERFEAIEAHHQAEDREEAKRLLYVAMTRAENSLFILIDPKKNRAGSSQELLFVSLGEAADGWIGAIPNEREPWSDVARETIRPDQPIPQVAAGTEFVETSVSELETILACPLKHHFIYRRQVPTEVVSLNEEPGATEIGTLLHAALNILHTAPNLEAKAAVDRLLASQGRSGEEGLAQNLETHLVEYQASPAFSILKSPIEDYSELPFFLKLGIGGLRGQIDRVVRDPNGWTLLDFKYAGRGHSRQELMETYGFQLKTYALAAQYLLREKLHSVQIHVLNRAEAHEIAYSELELSEHAGRLESLIHELAENRIDLGSVTLRKACRTCPYLRAVPLCPVPMGKSFRES